jgi:hypothetical protein
VSDAAMPQGRFEPRMFNAAMWMNDGFAQGAGFAKFEPIHDSEPSCQVQRIRAVNPMWRMLRLIVNV